MLGELQLKFLLKKNVMYSIINNVWFYNSNQSAIHLRIASVGGNVLQKEWVLEISDMLRLPLCQRSQKKIINSLSKN